MSKGTRSADYMQGLEFFIVPYSHSIQNMEYVISCKGFQIEKVHTTLDKTHGVMYLIFKYSIQIRL